MHDVQMKNIVSRLGSQEVLGSLFGSLLLKEFVYKESHLTDWSIATIFTKKRES